MSTSIGHRVHRPFEGMGDLSEVQVAMLINDGDPGFDPDLYDTDWYQD